MKCHSENILCNAYSILKSCALCWRCGLHKIDKVPTHMGLILQQGETGYKNTRSHFKEVLSAPLSGGWGSEDKHQL